MKLPDIQQAILECNRFIVAARAWEKRIGSNHLAQYGSKEGGAVRRASMDATRALAAVRRRGVNP